MTTRQRIIVECDHIEQGKQSKQCFRTVSANTENAAVRLAAQYGWYHESGVDLCPEHAVKEEVHRDNG